MPRVKIDYVVSFTSEDPEHPASNLLAWEVSKKKWLCKKGESSCSVVLQLCKAVKISAVHIGAYHSALVEVLVARSEVPQQFQVLVPSSVFVGAAESRRDAALERVRSFPAESLAAQARPQRWDRVRVVCSQPYNKHCKYGLSFIHIDGCSDVTASLPGAVPQRLLAMDTLSSDEEDFRPGELFAKHLQKNSDSQSSSSDTGAQIRQATSQALKNISDSATKLMKTPISKPNNRGAAVPSSSGRSDRSRDSLLYTDEDEKPHPKIDQLLQQHKDQKHDKERNEMVKEEKRTPKRRKSSSPPTAPPPPNKRPNKNNNETSDQSRRKEKKSGEVASRERTEQGSGECDPSQLLRDVVLVLSGYVNPQRAHIRNAALAMGARVERDWGPGCTHLICAFPNTPKLRAVRSSGGSAVPVALGDWLLQCAAERRRLDWRWFATEPAQRRPRPPAPDPQPSPPRNASDTECDTDDEIEKVVQKQKAKQVGGPLQPSASPPQKDEGPSTDEEDGEAPEVARLGGALPSFFDGYTFAVDDQHSDAEQLSRYIRAYGGLALQLSELEEDSEVDYIVATRSPKGLKGTRQGRRVSPGWVARCHRAGDLLPPD